MATEDRYCLCDDIGEGACPVHGAEMAAQDIVIAKRDKAGRPVVTLRVLYEALADFAYARHHNKKETLATATDKLGTIVDTLGFQFFKGAAATKGMGDGRCAHLAFDSHELALLWKGLDVEIKRRMRNGKARAKRKGSGIAAVAINCLDVRELQNKIFSAFRAAKAAEGR